MRHIVVVAQPHILGATPTTGKKTDGTGGKGKRKKKDVNKRKPTRYKIFRIVENFFGLQGQEQEKRTKKSEIF